MQSIKDLANSGLADTQADFPCLTHVFNYAGCDFANDTITCPITGLVLNFFAGAVIDNGNDTFLAGVTSSLTGILIAPNKVLVSGTANTNTLNTLEDSTATFVTDGIVVGDVTQTATGKETIITAVSQTALTMASDPFPNGNEPYEVARPLNTILIGVAPVNSSTKAFTYGDSTTAGAFMKAAANEYIVTNAGSDYHTLPATLFTGSNSTNTCLALAINWKSNSSTKYAYDDALGGVVSGTGVVTNSISEGISQARLVQEVVLPTGGVTEIKSFYILHFEGDLPTDINSAIGWMAYNDGLYPAWAGR